GSPDLDARRKRILCELDGRYGGSGRLPELGDRQQPDPAPFRCFFCGFRLLWDCQELRRDTVGGGDERGTGAHRISPSTAVSLDASAGIIAFSSVSMSALSAAAAMSSSGLSGNGKRIPQPLRCVRQHFSAV